MHIGIIMDGNGRWATEKGLSRLEGHSAGLETAVQLIRTCPVIGVSTMTLFAFAIANWKRDKNEVDGLWELSHQFFIYHLTELITEGVRVTVIGNRAGLPERVREDVAKAELDSKNNTKFLLQIALNYDGIDEVARMVQKTISLNIPVADITSEYIQNNLDTQSGDEPDILIRTGMPSSKNGMSVWRGSSFLPLQSVQSVCVSSEVLWPDFTAEHLKEVISFADLDSRLFGGQRK